MTPYIEFERMISNLLAIISDRNVSVYLNLFLVGGYHQRALEVSLGTACRLHLDTLDCAALEHSQGQVTFACSMRKPSALL